MFKVLQSKLTSPGLYLLADESWGSGQSRENFGPNVKTKLGIDYESLRQIYPRIVCGSISGFGQDGPYYKRLGFDQIAQGMGGLMSITGAPGEGPMLVGIPVPTSPRDCSAPSASSPRCSCACRR